MHYVQLGEQKGIGATSHLIRASGKNIVVDHGVGFERNGRTNINIVPDGNYLTGQIIDAIIITHSHVDHIGALVRLAIEHPEAPIFISQGAFDTGIVMLEDMLKIAESEQKRTFREGAKSPEMIFDWQDLENFLASDNIEIIDELCWLSPWPDWNIGFSWAGHDLGAMMVFIQPPNNRPMMITGDIASHDQEIVKGVMLPSENFLKGFLDLPNLVMITEGTNGNKAMLKPRGDIKTEFISTVNRIRMRGGQVLLPAFAKNRSSNVAMMLMESGIVPHIDGLARKLAEIEILNFAELVASGKIVIFENGEVGNKHRELAARGEDPCGHSFSPIISPSATLDQGFAVKHATAILPEPKNALIFTGYMFPGSTAEQITKIEKGRTVVFEDKNGNKIPVNVRCDVSHFDFTSHDYKDSLVERVHRVRPRDLIIHHCNKSSFTSLAVEIAKMDTPPRIHWGRHNKAFSF